jgi:hypothetical protein
MDGKGNGPSSGAVSFCVLFVVRPLGLIMQAGFRFEG